MMLTVHAISFPFSKLSLHQLQRSSLQEFESASDSWNKDRRRHVVIVAIIVIIQSPLN